MPVSAGHVSAAEGSRRSAESRRFAVAWRAWPGAPVRPRPVARPQRGLRRAPASRSPRRSDTSARPTSRRSASRAWLGLAHATGGLFRAFGPETLEKEQRRDGFPFLLVLLAIAGAVVEWFFIGAEVATDDQRLLGGRPRRPGGVRPAGPPDPPRGLAVPASVVRPRQRAHRHRVRALRPDARGVLPRRSAAARSRTRAFPALSEAGGVLGWMLGEPLALVLTEVGACIVLGILSLLSILILTKTPPNRIGRRLGDLYAWMFGEERPEPREQSAAAGRRPDDSRRIPSMPWWRRNKTGREEDPDGGIGSQDLTELLPPGSSQGGFEQAITTPAPVVRAARRRHRDHRRRPRAKPRAAQSDTSLRDDDGGADGELPGLSGIGFDAVDEATAHAVPPAVGQRARGRQPAQGPLRRQRRGGARAHERPRPVPGRRSSDGLLARSDSDAVRDRGRARREGRAHHGADQQHRVRRGVERGAHPRPDPGQERDRRRDPQCRPRDRDARRHPALARGAAVHAPHDDRRRQGRRRRVRRREPREDAAPPGGGIDRLGQVELRELDDHEPPHARQARRRADGAHRPQARRADVLRGRPAPHHAHHHEPEEGRRGAAVGREGDGHEVRRPRVVRLPAHRRLQPRRGRGRGRSSRRAASGCSSPTRTSSSSSTSSPTS